MDSNAIASFPVGPISQEWGERAGVTRWGLFLMRGVQPKHFLGFVAGLLDLYLMDRVDVVAACSVE